ncbi:Hypothetical predicted protein [Cloeon dipterum]|uniref:LITAF domain-containing protein n=1 Tax=Cloeon dipterum TaxID=197152 RepID=A0A8S1DQX8_9INSE|nr:Hypothetical predicted protein [Cloeon dipterum]
MDGNESTPTAKKDEAPAKNCFARRRKSRNHVLCSVCNASIDLKSKRKRPKIIAYLACFLVAILGCWCGCCLIPCCFNECYNNYYECPSCKTRLKIDF